MLTAAKSTTERANTDPQQHEPTASRLYEIGWVDGECKTLSCAHTRTPSLTHTHTHLLNKHSLCTKLKGRSKLVLEKLQLVFNCLDFFQRLWINRYFLYIYLWLIVLINAKAAKITSTETMINNCDVYLWQKSFLWSHYISSVSQLTFM